MSSLLAWLPWVVVSLLSIYLLDLLAHALRHLPPGPIPLPFIGSLHLIGDQPHRSLARLARTYGPLMSLRLGSVTTVVVSSSDVAREFLQKHDAVFASRYVSDAIGDDHARNSVIFLHYGPRWRSLRKTVATELFAPHRLDALQGLRSEKVREREDVAARDGDKAGLDRDTLRAIFTDLFVAGSDTSSTTVEWAMVELLRNPPSMAKAHEELAQVIASRRSVKESDIDHLPYLQAVVTETLRLHTPGPFLLPRKARATIRIGGYTVPQGARVLVNLWAMSRDEANWTEPEKFMPERFLGRTVDYKGGGFELIPFGAGRRSCPGMSLGMRMVHLVLATLLGRFEWRLPVEVERSGIDMAEKFGVTLTKAMPLCAIPTPI